MSIDYAIFEWINQDLANPFFDQVLPIYRDKLTWVPLYVVIAYYMVKLHGWRSAAYLLLCIAVVITVADQIAAEIIKPGVGRLRPCAQPAVADTVRSLVPCGGKFSFPSNHATNHFALATVLALTLLEGHRVLIWVAFLWAASIALAQVYVGKHWPGDVLAGALFGTAVAYLGVITYRRLAGQQAIPPPPAPAKSPLS